MRRCDRILVGVLVIAVSAERSFAQPPRGSRPPGADRQTRGERPARGGLPGEAGRRVYLLDTEGRVVHKWPIGTNPHLLDDGNILDASKDDPSGFQGFKEVDWDGKAVWEYVEKREGYAPHHDWVRSSTSNSKPLPRCTSPTNRLATSRPSPPVLNVVQSVGQRLFTCGAQPCDVGLLLNHRRKCLRSFGFGSTATPC